MGMESPLKGIAPAGGAGDESAVWCSGLRMDDDNPPPDECGTVCDWGKKAFAFNECE